MYAPLLLLSPALAALASAMDHQPRQLPSNTFGPFNTTTVTYLGPTATVTTTFTTCYTTSYAAICPTIGGICTQTYTVTETCTHGPCKPHTSTPPPGFTTHVTKCNHCGPGTTDITITTPAPSTTTTSCSEDVPPPSTHTKPPHPPASHSSTYSHPPGSYSHPPGSHSKPPGSHTSPPASHTVPPTTTETQPPYPPCNGKCPPKPPANFTTTGQHPPVFTGGAAGQAAGLFGRMAVAGLVAALLL